MQVKIIGLDWNVAEAFTDQCAACHHEVCMQAISLLSLQYRL